MTDLDDFYNDSEFLYDYVRALKTEMPPGTNIIGALSARKKVLLEMGGMEDMADILIHAPGDRTIDLLDDDNAVKIGIGVPIAYDIWYIYSAGNMLEFGGKSIEESMTKMEVFFDSIAGAKPLKSPPGGPASATIDCEGFVYTIKEARFETYLGGNGAAFDSVGPAEGGKDFAGYVAIPIGPVGVMWRISMATESSLSEGTGGNVFPASGDNSTTPGGEILPPFDFSVRETCGEMMMNKGYLLDDKGTCELFSDDDAYPPHKWLRYWIKKENTTIIPGEFAGILCRPWPLHCWWKQETAPFVYAGNWIETEFYTSGVVKEVIAEGDYTAEKGELGNRYKVWVKNEEILVKSTDFLEYEVGDRVGLLKTYREGQGGSSYGGSMTSAGDGGGTTNFSWRELGLQNTEEALNTEWVILPVDFYGATGGNSVGGA